LHKPGNVQIENRKGDVQVTLAPDTAVRVEARSKGGEISSDFSELQINNAEHQASATGSIGSNGPNLVINSEHGSVEIRRGNVAVTPPAPPAVPQTRQTCEGRESAASAEAAPVESELGHQKLSSTGNCHPERSEGPARLANEKSRSFASLG
jgi:hypothetical protein